ncbi:MAG: DNA primase [Limnoraphis sp.]
MISFLWLIQSAEFPNTMISEVHVLNSMKISSEFAVRLTRLNSNKMIRVIVFLETETEAQQKSPQEVQEIAENKLNNIRPILTKYQAELLSEHPNILGSIGVNITVAGVYALLESPSVKMIMEDQGIFPR